MKQCKLLIFLTLIASLYQCKNDSEIMKNPLILEFETLYQVPPFHLVKHGHFMPALAYSITEHEKEIDSIIANTQNPSFENTLVAFDRSGRKLKNVQSVFFGLRSAHATDEIQKIAGDFSKKTTEHFDNIYMNYELFKRVEGVYLGKDTLKLDTGQEGLLNYYYKQFVRRGVNLPDDKKEELRQINQKLTGLATEFDKNLLSETNSFSLIIEDEKELAGLPNDVIAAAAATANNMKLKGKWVFTTHKPSMIPFLQYSECRDLRGKLYDAYCNRGNNNNEYDNKSIIAEMVSLRTRKADLLGYSTYAAYELDDRMAENPDNVMNFLDKIWNAALPVAVKERDDMQSIINREGGDFLLSASDWWYYAERVRAEKYNFDENELRSYFELNRVRDGVFTLCKKLFGLDFIEIEGDFPKPHPDAEIFQVKDFDGSHLGLLYLDYYTRPTKNQGAWCGVYRRQYKTPDANIRPVVTIVCNFANPTGDAPVLLSLDDVLTLFHEFGHGLHHLLSDVSYEGISGTAVKRDFVELPSQIMENWATDPNLIKKYAKHYATNEPISDELLQKLYSARFFNQGFATVEYLAASFLDMHYHLLKEVTEVNVDSFENASMESIRLIPEIIPRYRSTYFKHIWSSGYQAGYYSYLWAEILDKDAFDAFREEGIFNIETAKAFRKNILEKGGSEEPMELYKKFRGREPRIEPLLRDRGLL